MAIFNRVHEEEIKVKNLRTESSQEQWEFIQESNHKREWQISVRTTFRSHLSARKLL